ncbi:MULTISPECIES: hypothetical protein [Microbacterium]|uniref:Uncharacterized protein n=1 Tax=Microbacterium aurugineum TaxID=2851642 RepID=A0ABY4IWV7_9MICO|nr:MULTISPECIES: hypothetical protein [Microbacterium]MCK8478095.1 hypothetical protein [Microbacterium aurugineum]MCZ4301791.1 hypothetical protein [Microbacterium oxydans]PKQ34432.1 MAG: hypothetical protein CVT61_11115 [Actinobacteria bacterium HGW-Actinobacteria-11]UPL16497.1 hypothetical protein KV397_01360 [Microbacterium aurugineum]
MSAESARRTVRILTWTGFATGIIGGLLIAFPKVIGPASPWVQLALGVATLVLAFRARKVGIDEVEGFDGRLSLAAALLGFLVLFFAGQAAFIFLSTLG